jgi:hypothetical protein
MIKLQLICSVAIMASALCLDGQGVQAASPTLRGGERQLASQVKCGGLSMTQDEWNVYWPEDMSPQEWIFATVYSYKGNSCTAWDDKTIYLYHDGMQQKLQLSNKACRAAIPKQEHLCAVTNGGTGGVSTSSYTSSVNLRDTFLDTPDIQYKTTSDQPGTVIGQPLQVMTYNYGPNPSLQTASFSNSISSTSTNSVSQTTSMTEGMTIKVGGGVDPVSMSMTDSFTVSSSSTFTTSQSTTIGTGASQQLTLPGNSCGKTVQTASEDRLTQQWSGTVISNGFYMFDSKQGKHGDYKLMDMHHNRQGFVNGVLTGGTSGSLDIVYKNYVYSIAEDGVSCDFNKPIGQITSEESNAVSN